MKSSLLNFNEIDEEHISCTLAYGHFTTIHAGHIRYLKHAKALGNKLIIALAGDEIVNYAPFPAELIFPRSGKNVTPGVNNLITLSWTTSDVDGDLLKFEVYLDDNDASTLIESIDYVEDNTSIEIEVQNNTKYYWKIISIDLNGNQSNSGVYAFRTN